MKFVRSYSNRDFSSLECGLICRWPKDGYTVSLRGGERADFGCVHARILNCECITDFGERGAGARLTRGARELRGPVGKSSRCCVLLGTRVCDQLAEPIQGAEHLIKILHGALKLARLVFAVKDLHRLFDGKNLVEQLRDRLTQLQCFRSSWRSFSHPQYVGTKSGTFQAAASAAGDRSTR